MTSLAATISVARDWISAGDVKSTERRYLQATFAAGLILGLIISFASNLMGAAMILMVGFGLGYGLRSYVSFQRRQAAFVKTLEQAHAPLPYAKRALEKDNSLVRHQSSRQEYASLTSALNFRNADQIEEHNRAELMSLLKVRKSVSSEKPRCARAQ